MYVISQEGILLRNYRKHFFFGTDKIWAKHGPCFDTVKIKNREGVEYKAGLAICQDIKANESSDDSQFELSNYMKKEQINVLLFIAG